MKYDDLTLVELKQIAKNKHIKGYSKLNKIDLISLLKKNKSGGGCDHDIICNSGTAKCTIKHCKKNFTGSHYKNPCICPNPTQKKCSIQKKNLYTAEYAKSKSWFF